MAPHALSSSQLSRGRPPSRPPEARYDASSLEIVWRVQSSPIRDSPWLDCPTFELTSTEQPLSSRSTFVRFLRLKKQTTETTVEYVGRLIFTNLLNITPRKREPLHSRNGVIS